MIDDNRIPETREEVAERLAALRLKRGYLLPHHGLLAVAEPRLLDAYDAMYTALTLNPRCLSEHAKEFVWLTILASTQEAIATHHIRRWRDAGGSDRDLELALRLAAFAQGADCFNFVQRHWRAHLPVYDAERVYREGISALGADSAIQQGWTEMALAAAHACHRRWWALGLHIRGAYQAGVEEPALAEALSLTMFPGGVPNFVDACAHWRELILTDAVNASPAFRAWAELSGQGGYDEASGVTKPAEN